jgi:hypothetical protein
VRVVTAKAQAAQDSAMAVLRAQNVIALELVRRECPDCLPLNVEDALTALTERAQAEGIMISADVFGNTAIPSVDAPRLVELLETERAAALARDAERQRRDAEQSRTVLAAGGAVIRVDTPETRAVAAAAARELAAALAAASDAGVVYDPVRSVG